MCNHYSQDDANSKIQFFCQFYALSQANILKKLCHLVNCVPIVIFITGESVFKNTCKCCWEVEDAINARLNFNFYF